MTDQDKKIQVRVLSGTMYYDKVPYSKGDTLEIDERRLAHLKGKVAPVGEAVVPSNDSQQVKLADKLKEVKAELAEANKKLAKQITQEQLDNLQKQLDDETEENARLRKELAKAQGKSK